MAKKKRGKTHYVWIEPENAFYTACGLGAQDGHQVTRERRAVTCDHCANNARFGLPLRG